MSDHVVVGPLATPWVECLACGAIERVSALRFQLLGPRPDGAGPAAQAAYTDVVRAFTRAHAGCPARVQRVIRRLAAVRRRRRQRARRAPRPQRAT